MTPPYNGTPLDVTLRLFDIILHFSVINFNILLKLSTYLYPLYLKTPLKVLPMALLIVSL